MSSVNDNYFTTASETYSDNLSSSIGAAATTVPVNNASVYATGETVVLTVDPGTANEATFIGKKDTTNQFIECVWTEGNTGVGHDTGATIIDYDSATHHNAQSKGILQFANQDGTLVTSAVRAALNLTDESTAGWEVGTIPAPDTVTNNGNRSYDLVFNSTDYTGIVSEGMRVRTTRTVAAPDQCADFEKSSSQYASVSSPSGITFTDDFTVEAWVKLESYDSTQAIVSRYDGATGWLFDINSTGQMRIYGDGTDARYMYSYQQLPLNRWVHVAATLNMSANSATMYINGVSIDVDSSTGVGTSITQAGDLQVGAWNGTNFFDGKISDVRVWGDIRNEAEIRANMSQYPSDTTGLVAHFKLDGDWTDSSSNGNDLTASGGPTFASDAPHGNSGVSTTLDYGIITAKSFSTNTTLTVQVPEGCTIPTSGGITAFAYSLVDTPFGFPKGRDKWTLEYGDAIAQAITVSTSYQPTISKAVVPVGAWNVAYTAYGQLQVTGTSARLGTVTLSSDGTTETDSDFNMTFIGDNPVSGTSTKGSMVANNKNLSIDTATTYTILTKINNATGVISNEVGGQNTVTRITAECAYL